MQITLHKPVRSAAILVTCAALAGCGSMGAGKSDRADQWAVEGKGFRLGGLFSKKAPSVAPTPGDGVVEIDGVAYQYDFEAMGTPMAPTVIGDGLAAEQLAPAENAAPVPILRIGRADGVAMTQGTKGSSQQVASFLCSENPSWAQTVPVLMIEGEDRVPAPRNANHPDWVAAGQWNIVRPCG